MIINITNDYYYFEIYKISFTCSSYIPANIYLFKVNDRNIIEKCKIYSKLTRKIPQWRQWSRSSVFAVNFEHN